MRGLKNPLSIFILLFIGYSVYDYFDHILRPGSTFEEHPGDWLIFTTAGTLSFILIVYGVKVLLQKVTNSKNLLFELLGVALWGFLYISFLGPLIDLFFWPYDDLYFSNDVTLVLILCSIFLVIRIPLNLVLKKKILYSC